MFAKKTKTQALQSVRSRRSAQPASESFRRNAVVFSRAQKEVAAAKQTVTQRQVERQRSIAGRRSKIKVAGVLALAIVLMVAYRMNLNTISLETNASSRLTGSDSAVYASAIESAFKSHTIAGQWWLADTDALIREVKQQFPEVERMSVGSKAPLTSALEADVRFRKAVFTWADAGGQQQFVDKEGVLFSKNLDPTVNPAKLIKIEDQSGVVINAGNAVLTKGLIQFIGQLHTKLPPLYPVNTKITRVIIPKSTREVQVQMSGQPYLIKFNSIRDINQQVGELASLLAYLKSKNINPAEYIDMRVQHKVFYK